MTSIERLKIIQRTEKKYLPGILALLGMRKHKTYRTAEGKYTFYENVEVKDAGAKSQ